MKRSHVLVPALITALGLLPACSGSSGGGGSAATTTAPSTSGSGSLVGFNLLVSTPQDGETDVRVDQALILTFTEAVDPVSLAAGIDLRTDTGPVAIQLQAVTPTVVEVRPASPTLDAHTNHLLRLTTQIASLAGAPLPQEVLIRFTTGMPRVAVPPPAPTGVPPQVVGPYVAGAAAVDITPPLSVEAPLAGFGGGDRRHMPLPDLNPFNAHTFLEPASGIHDPIMAKALVLGNGADTFCLVTLDAIASDAAVIEEAWTKAQAQGFSLPLEKVLVCSSHTHSGPGALSKRFFWQIVAADLFSNQVFQPMTDGIAQAMLQAEQQLAPVVVGVGNAFVTTATRNRRANDSPDLDDDSIDPELIAIRVDRLDGTPVATVWNFAVHGTLFGTKTHDYSADIMGSASLKAEAQIGGIALFVNGAEGDIKPRGDWTGTGQLLADTIAAARAAAVTSPQGIVQSIHTRVDMGRPTIDASLQRNGAASARMLNSGLVQALQRFGIGAGISLALPQGWVEREFRFQAVRIGDSIMASFPGEPIHEIGLLVKQDGKAMGFTHVLPACLANGHGSYFTTETEYWYGGYEALASFFGPKNGQTLLDTQHGLMQQLR